MGCCNLQCEIQRDWSQFIGNDWYMDLRTHLNLFCFLFLNRIHFLFELLLLSQFDDFLDPQMLPYVLDLLMKFLAFIFLFQLLFRLWQWNGLRDRFVGDLEQVPILLKLPLVDVVTNLAFILRALIVDAIQITTCS